MQLYDNNRGLVCLYVADLICCQTSPDRTTSTSCLALRLQGCKQRNVRLDLRVSVCLRALPRRRWESTDGLPDTSMSASDCGGIKRHVNGSGCTETIYGPFVAGGATGRASRSHQEQWKRNRFIQVYQRDTLDLCFWHRSERNTSLLPLIKMPLFTCFSWLCSVTLFLSAQTDCMLFVSMVLII